MASSTGRTRSNRCDVFWFAHRMPSGIPSLRGEPRSIRFLHSCHSRGTVSMYVGQLNSESCDSSISAFVRRDALGHRSSSFNQSDGHSGCVVWEATLLVRAGGTGQSTFRCPFCAICFCLLALCIKKEYLHYANTTYLFPTFVHPRRSLPMYVLGSLGATGI